MSAITLPSPGSDLGPCMDECAHRDCAATRATASALCVHCDHQIGYGSRFYEVFRSEDGKDRDYAHASCHEAAEARR